MDETMNENNQKGGSKKLLAIILVAVLVVAGAVAAFALLNKSPKAKYFLAEKQSFDKVAEHVKEQYQPEVDWYEITQKNPVKNDFELTGNYESPYGGFSTDDMFSPEQIVNNSKLKVSTQTDLENKKATMTLNGSMGEIETGDIAFSIDSHKLSAKLPFLDELLQIKDKDLAKLMNEADPMNENKFTLDFTKFFEKSSVPEEDLEYLKKNTLI
ncbi:DUF6583 family protein [Virgibacillus sp. 179-BFC.A HS]|uniref:DUF6583 family protein n=1 Tax=Tigheibacillus jepli TaxID=3035914 RepID=A0ABU5CGE6_9BACI|nr:DUF6583 family protein [Virgibacillus sp. 179-BFC.A HS]MDY0405393.1 DUF6583 family protein [Virgibacillus sp. 179-BFC.A HS]